jgi:hypothetical protein
VFAPLRFVAVAIDVVQAQIVVRDAGERHRVVPAAERLRDEPRRHQVQPRPAIFLRHGDAEQALRADLWERVLGPPLLRVHANGQAVQFGAREAVGLVEDEVLFGVEFEGRRAIVADRDGVARSQAFLPSRGAAQGARRSRGGDVPSAIMNAFHQRSGARCQCCFAATQLNRSDPERLHSNSAALKTPDETGLTELLN